MLLLLPAPIDDWYNADDQQIRYRLLAYDRVVREGEEALSRAQRRRIDRLTDANAADWFRRLAADELRLLDIADPPLDRDSVWTVKGHADVFARAAVTPFAVSRFELFTLRRMAGLTLPRRLAETGGRLFDQDLHDRGLRGLAWLAAAWEGKSLAAGRHDWPPWLDRFVAGDILTPTDVAARSAPDQGRSS